MIAIVTENFGGRWPFWLSPVQAMVMPVVPKFNAYAVEVRNRLRLEGFMVDVDVDDSCQLQKKVFNAQTAHYNYMFVVGGEEEQHKTVNVRTRDNKVAGEKTLDEVIAHFKALASERVDRDFEGTVENKPTPKADGDQQSKKKAQNQGKKKKKQQQQQQDAAAADASAPTPSGSADASAAADPTPAKSGSQTQFADI